MIVGIGIDAVDIDRIERMFASKRRSDAQPPVQRRRARVSLGEGAPAQHLAVRLAAKEAAYKALSGNELARGIGWRDIEVFSRSDGSPELRLHGRAAARFAELGATTIHVSLTHSADDGNRGRNRRALMELRRTALHARRQSRYIPSAMNLTAKLGRAVAVFALAGLPLRLAAQEQHPVQRVANIVSVAVEEYGKGIDEKGRLISADEYQEAVGFLDDARDAARACPAIAPWSRRRDSRFDHRRGHGEEAVRRSSTR